ncbi:S8 family serine peptidase [Georgenia yuyongxinii]
MVRVLAGAVVAAVVLSGTAAQGAVVAQEEAVLAQEEAVAHTIAIAPGTEDHVREELAKLGVEPSYEFTATADGFTAELTARQAAVLEAHPAVESAEAGRPISVLETQTDVTWGLDRIDQISRSLDTRYTYPASAGQGVRVYVLDTGVTPLPDFGGRVAAGADFTGDGRNTTADCNGHGTHVAGTIASRTFGVAKRATIVPVRVLGCTGQGATSAVNAAVDWVVANHPRGTPGVINLSIGGTDADPALEAALRRVVEVAGLTVVVAAGNDNTDAARVSPARVAELITVGASTDRDTRWVKDAARGSNWGSRLDLFAPGAGVVSLNYAAAGGTATMTGTSAAAPHVAGAAALYLGQVPGATPAAVAEALTRNASPVMAVSGDGSPNLLLNVEVPAALPAGVERLGGTDRYATSAKISAATFAPGVPVAYVATGAAYADALAGAAAAGGAGPVLLVAGRSVPAAVDAELARLRPGRIVVLGGEGAVSRAVLDALRTYTAGAVTRLGGSDRYDTAALVSAATFSPGVPVAYVATGAAYADALAGAAAAGGAGPVLLVAGRSVPAAVDAAGAAATRADRGARRGRRGGTRGGGGARPPRGRRGDPPGWRRPVRDRRQAVVGLVRPRGAGCLPRHGLRLRRRALGCGGRGRPWPGSPHDPGQRPAGGGRGTRAAAAWEDRGARR